MTNVPHRPRPSDMCFPVDAIWGGPGNTAFLEEVHYWLDLKSSPPGPNFGWHSAVLEVKGGLSHSFLLPCCPCNYRFSFETFSQKQTLL